MCLTDLLFKAGSGWYTLGKASVMKKTFLIYYVTTAPVNVRTCESVNSAEA